MIRQATLSDIDQTEQIYKEILLRQRERAAYTVWKEGIYPTRETAEKSLSDGALYVMEQNGKINASIIINQIQPKEYGRIKWKYPARPNEVAVVHLLCVRPSKSGLGIGKDMVKFAARQAKQMNCKTVRLDTGSQNKPAVALYTKLGFELAGTSTMSVGGLISHDNHLFFELKI